MSGEAHWVTEQPNWGERHVRSISDLKVGMKIKLHLRVGSEDKQTPGTVSAVDPEQGQFKLSLVSMSFNLSDFGVTPTLQSGIKVWSRHNWIERTG